MLIQAPGSFVFVYSLAIQPGTNWTTWISFAVCGSFQFLLIVLYIIFETGRGASLEEEEPLLGDNFEEGDINDDLLATGDSNRNDSDILRDDQVIQVEEEVVISDNVKANHDINQHIDDLHTPLVESPLANDGEAHRVKGSKHQPSLD